MCDNHPQNPNEYELKIDAQVEKFFEIKQKLTYFLITASVAVIAFLANFVIEHQSEISNFIWLAIFSSISGLLTSGCSLLNLHLELISYKLHLKYRYERKTLIDLTDVENKKWDKVNLRAFLFLKIAFFLLFIEIAFAVVFFVLFFYFN